MIDHGIGTVRRRRCRRITIAVIVTIVIITIIMYSVMRHVDRQ